ncbi:hypothetical protein [Oenococcus kitaharae]|uniref:Uncharacterized protein n=1 Tax=Oenococcus kitaharae DSM 17330 TaxID=1045004 RepID=G9WHP1_9LACO|nr:hypothetical protein [Oenococcus kitaharae]EHN58615.1 hypothetical protein OKIT_0499 [Oenococcus kitaharae DSM 17330]
MDSYPVTKPIDWKDLFLLWAPNLIQARTSHDAKNLLETALQDFVGHNRFTINENLFQTIKTQFCALQLIQDGPEKSVNDGYLEFVSLTKKGRNYMLQEKTIKK